MNPSDKIMDEDIHRHLEIEKSDTTITVSVFDTPSTGDLEIDIHRSDNEGKIEFNTKCFCLLKNSSNCLIFSKRLDARFIFVKVTK